MISTTTTTTTKNEFRNILYITKFLKVRFFELCNIELQYSPGCV